MDTVYALDGREILSRFKDLTYNSKIRVQKSIAEYIVREHKPKFQSELTEMRVAPLLDTFEVWGWDVGITFNTIRDVKRGYAVVNGGTEPVRMKYRSKWEEARKRGRNFWEMLRRKDISDMGDILVECRPEGILVRKNYKELIELCEEVTELTGQELKLRF
ncbi:MAG: hypothetical protein AABW91_01740 [Nanoarchaeota archaeon]